ncbi:MAG: hypothetical protein RLY86_1976 [Pseudomonadota bacterium]
MPADHCRPLVLFVCVAVAMLLPATRPTGAALAAEACRLRVAYELEPPRAMIGPKGEMTGVVVEVAQALARRLDCRLELVERPWSRQLADLVSGRVDMVLGIRHTAERERFGRYTIPYFHGGGVSLFVRTAEAQHWSAIGLADLSRQSFRLGIGLAVRHGPEIDALATALDTVGRLERVRDADHFLPMLRAGHIDGFIATPVLATRLAAGMPDIAISPIIPMTGAGAMHGMTSRATVDDAAAARIDVALTELSRDGTIPAIFAIHGVAASESCTGTDGVVAAPATDTTPILHTTAIP